MRSYRARHNEGSDQQHKFSGLRGGRFICRSNYTIEVFDTIRRQYFRLLEVFYYMFEPAICIPLSRN